MDDDWNKFLEELGLTQETMDEAAKTLPTPIKEEDPSYFVSDSPIGGKGVFAKKDMNGFLGKLRSGNDWYVAGRYANHSPTPNAIPVRFGDELAMVGEVKKGEEITLNYRDVRKLLGY